MFPCWDEPNIKATFDIIVVHPEDHIVLSNTYGETEKSTLLPNSLLTKFMVTPPIPASDVKIIVIDKYMNSIPVTEIDMIWHCPESTRILKFAHSVIQSVRMFLFTFTKRVMTLEHIIIPNSPVKATGSNGLIIYRYTAHN